MAEFPSKVSTRTSSPAQGGGAAVSALRPDLGFVRSSLGALMLLQLVSARLGPGVRGRGVAGCPGGPGGVGGSRAALFACFSHTPNPGSHAPRCAVPSSGAPLGRTPPRSPWNPLTPRRPSCRLFEHTQGAPMSECPPQRPITPSQVVTKSSPTEALTKATITARHSLSLFPRLWLSLCQD